MTLDRYLIFSNTTSHQFAKMMKVSLSAVGKWRQHTRIPRGVTIKKIERLTNGRVKPKDWYS